MTEQPRLLVVEAGAQPIRDALAVAIARGLGLKGAFGKDWGLGHGERARCYAAADAVLLALEQLGKDGA